MLSIALSIAKVELYSSEVAFSKNLLDISVMFRLNITFFLRCFSLRRNKNRLK